MVNRLQRLTILLACGAAGLILTACGPRYVPIDTLGHGNSQSQGAYYQQGYSQHAAYRGASANTHYSEKKSRYGYETAGQPHGLQAPCGEVFAPCGFTRVLPVYPIYQVTAPTKPEPAAEVPTIDITEPEPVMIYEPAPEPEYIYTPDSVHTPAPYHWPEPEAEVPSWAPLRK